MLELDPDRLLHNFRQQAGLASTAEPLQGWESPTCGLRGHFVGHYLSALAFAFAASGESTLLKRVHVIVDGLRACQDQIGNGYVGAIPESDLDVIETKFDGAWAPYYVVHKILAGLIDAHRLAGSAAALHVARALGDYLITRLAKLTPVQWEGMCRTGDRPNPTNEFGGIGEALQDLSELTGDPRYDAAARQFDRPWFVQPLMARQDHLTGLHANTHIPMVLSLARRYERTGDLQLRDLAAYFWERTAIARSFVTGGSTGPRPDRTEKSVGAEHWPSPYQLAQTLTPKNNESCVTHNMLRLTDALFRWTDSPLYADFFERAYLNHVLTMQHPGYPGGYIYDHPLAPQSRKKFGHAHDAFWCCYGSSIEAYTRLTTGLFYLRDDEIRINMFVASECDWPERGVVIRQQGDVLTGTLDVTVRCAQPTDFAISIRVPTWATRASIALGPQTQEVKSGSVVTLRRTWNDEEIVTLRFTPAMVAESMPDDARMIAFRAGPLVLAALSDRPLQLAHPDVASALAALKTTGSPRRFRIELADGNSVELIPVNEVVDEQFGVYFTLVDSVS